MAVPPIVKVRVSGLGGVAMVLSMVANAVFVGQASVQADPPTAQAMVPTGRTRQQITVHGVVGQDK